MPSIYHLSGWVRDVDGSFAQPSQNLLNRQGFIRHVEPYERYSDSL